MKNHVWDIAKNLKLIHERNISFDEIVYQIDSGGLLDIIEHPNQFKYPRQQMYIVRAKGYAWMVPFVETETHTILKTIIPSRKMTKKYLK